jgi:hypothetical protein
LVDGELLIDLQGKGKVPMIPLSETMFSPRLLGTYQFIKNDQGVVTHMLVHSAEEVLTAVRPGKSLHLNASSLAASPIYGMLDGPCLFTRRPSS